MPVHDDDSPATLMARVQKAEHQLYPNAVRWLVSDAVSLDGQITKLAASAGSALQFAANSADRHDGSAADPEAV